MQGKPPQGSAGQSEIVAQMVDRGEQLGSWGSCHIASRTEQNIDYARVALHGGVGSALLRSKLGGLRQCQAF